MLDQATATPQIYVTKYALTTGIQVFVFKSMWNNTVCCKSASGLNKIELFGGPHWHRTPQDAISHAEKMRDRRIAALKRSIQRLENLTFNERDFVVVPAT